MLELLQEAFGDEGVKWEVLALRLSVALVLGCAVGAVYHFTHEKDNTNAPSFITTLVLLTVLIAIVTQVIGNNSARAFSLVGALAIIRFRTVVEDTRDTAFVIFAVVIGMAIGAGYLKGALIGLAIVGFAAFVVRPRRLLAKPQNGDWTLAVRVGLGNDADAVLPALFGKHLSNAALLATATGRQGAALDMTYRVSFLPSATPAAFVKELNQLPGIQSVELRRD
jgi:uncharacterized membrane protein YhiD involved in acid resistance